MVRVVDVDLAVSPLLLEVVMAGLKCLLSVGTQVSVRMLHLDALLHMLLDHVELGGEGDVGQGPVLGGVVFDEAGVVLLQLNTKARVNDLVKGLHHLNDLDNLQPGVNILLQNEMFMDQKIGVLSRRSAGKMSEFLEEYSPMPCSADLSGGQAPCPSSCRCAG